MFDNIVTVKSRTGKSEQFIYDGAPHTIDAKRGIKVPRVMAELALKQNALRWDSSTGLVIDAKVYIEDDLDTENATPSVKLEEKEIEAVKNTDGLGNDSILVNGEVVKKTVIDFKNPYKKEDYSKNNIG